MQDPYRARRFKCGEDLYATIGIPRDNKPARLGQFARNLRLPPEVMLFSGMALGYMDENAPINSLRTERAALDECATLHGY